MVKNAGNYALTIKNTNLWVAKLMDQKGEKIPYLVTEKKFCVESKLFNDSGCSITKYMVGI